jgi:hypothetical protein
VPLLELDTAVALETLDELPDIEDAELPEPADADADDVAMPMLVLEVLFNVDDMLLPREDTAEEAVDDSAANCSSHVPLLHA